MSPESGKVDIKKYMNQCFSCNCGKQHSFYMKEIIIKSGALKEIPSFCKTYQYKKLFLVYDRNTMKAAGTKLRELLDEQKISYEVCLLAYEELIPNEQVLGEILIAYDRSCDLIVAVGSGTINDLCKFISTKLGVDYIVAATAPSMDGFVSDCAPLIIKNMKVTFSACPAVGIFGDTDILKEAPMEMIAAGAGDILGKLTALTDWEIAHVVTGEYYCKEVASLVEEAVKVIGDHIPQIVKRSDDMVEKVMEGLLLSGIAMCYVGMSRPASGSEHHLSHYWEMQYLFQGRKPVLHGIKVGLGTCTVIRLYHWLFKQEIDFSSLKEEAYCEEYEEWKKRMRIDYQDAYESVVALEDKIGKNKKEAVLKRQEQMERHWAEIKEIVKRRLPADGQVEEMLKMLKAPYTPEQIGIEKDMFFESIRAAKELRNRFGLLQMLYDLHLFPSIPEMLYPSVPRE